MKWLLWTTVLGIAVPGIRHLMGPASPSVSETEPAVRAYLSSPEQNNRAGTMTVEQLDRISIGDYAKEFGGWPVYASRAQTCHEGGNSSSFDGRIGPERKVAAAFVRRSTSGDIEVFTPAVFRNAQREMQQPLQKAFDDGQVG